MSERLVVHQMSVGPLQVNCFIVACKKTSEAAVIDPGEDAERILKVIADEALEVSCLINTHGHFDHIGANRQIVERTGAELLIHADDLPLLQRTLPPIFNFFYTFRCMA